MPLPARGSLLAIRIGAYITLCKPDIEILQHDCPGLYEFGLENTPGLRAHVAQPPPIGSVNPLSYKDSWWLARDASTAEDLPSSVTKVQISGCRSCSRVRASGMYALKTRRSPWYCTGGLIGSKRKPKRPSCRSSAGSATIYQYASLQCALIRSTQRISPSMGCSTSLRSRPDHCSMGSKLSSILRWLCACSTEGVSSGAPQGLTDSPKRDLN